MKYFSKGLYGALVGDEQYFHYTETVILASVTPRLHYIYIQLQT
jgi:hypothetical protein